MNLWGSSSHFVVIATIGANTGSITMQWYAYIAYFFGGAFSANAFPHLIAGVSGQPLQSPFA